MHYVDILFESIPKEVDKARVQAYLATMKKIANTIGIVAKKAYWDFAFLWLFSMSSEANYNA